ncbi:hypothetical protein HYH02_014581 [Chlamydomonas schloesseri]|uniref:Protein SirB1 N-terminal domain-containing protein n=1 Tax=Chlamydomonas schloesseri TaxID=2026947 RepID=A0A835SVW9_9CHLO|nr:hypothetical protein HYH02_014581 [Chlamydomonas schloesseri]|eukprot:KAG2427535.1 hypothetical protein HYH02_014581 [Chlamydomonas schloesseri]
MAGGRCPATTSLPVARSRGTPAHPASRRSQPERCARLRPNATGSGDSGEAPPPADGSGQGGSGPEAGPGPGSGPSAGGEALGGQGQGADQAPLTLGAGVLSRMRQLRALDEYRALMEEVAELESKQQGPGGGGAGAGAGRSRGGSSSGSGTGTGASSSTRGSGAAPRASYSSSSCSELLLRGALLIARHRHPELDEGAVRGVLDDMARQAAALLPAEAERRYPLRVVAAINRVMYVDYGFRGNQEDYYSADNSCINKVVERRVGIPITLSLVYMEVGRRLGLTLRGVNLPGHFMIQPLRPPAAAAAGGGRQGSASGGGASSGEVAASGAGPAGSGVEAGIAGAGAEDGEDEDEEGPLEVLIDAFKGGEVCYPAEAEERLSELLGAPVRIDPQALKESRPLPPRTFLLRMLSNLRSIYLSTQQVDSLLTVVKFMRATLEATPPPPPALSAGAAGGLPARSPPAVAAADAGSLAALARDEGLCYFALKRYPEAVEALREYLAVDPALVSPEEAQTVAAVLEEARRRMRVNRPERGD